MKRRKLYVFLIILLVLTALVASAVFYLPVYLKKKITTYVNTQTPYNIEIANISLGPSSLVIRGTEFRPKSDKAAFAKNKGYETDWISVKVNIIKIEGISWRVLLFQKKLVMNYAEVSDAEIDVFRDKRLPNKPIYKSLPSTLLRKAGFQFIIPELNAQNCRVVYEEITEKTKESLVVPFGQLEARFLHMSSDAVYMKQHPEMSIEASASIFDSIKTRIHYSANVLDPNDTYTLTGKTGSFSATLLNRIEEATHLGIKSGYVERIDFSFEADEQRAIGKMNINYKELKVKVSKEEKQSGIKSLLANVLIRNDDDRANRRGTYTGKIDFNRRKDKFIFNYWWNAFKSGITSSLLKKPVG